ncbi:hypothetical protein [Burkholderia sp. NLJ2]|uniref:hypothetical protein n=1 Tax=Burkholderia sp. NLJ2 TaxID=3090699 RepID=UPI003C6C1527
MRILHGVWIRGGLVKNTCERHDVSEQKFDRGRNKPGGVKVVDVRRRRKIGSESDRFEAPDVTTRSDAGLAQGKAF